MTKQLLLKAFSLGDNFYDSESGEFLENYEGSFYFKGQIKTVMYTWLENGERHCSMNPKPQVTQSGLNFSEIDASILAADYKARGIDRNSSYGFFVKDRNLKPELSAKQFFNIYDSVISKKLERSIVLTAFNISEMTHLVEQNNQKARPIKLLEQNQHFIRFSFENGSTGTTLLKYVQSLTII